jgi:hypothetical protein
MPLRTGCTEQEAADMPTGERTRREVVMNVRFSEQERADLVELAESDDKSIAAVVRTAIKQYVAVRATSR